MPKTIEQKRTEADERRAAYEARSVEEQMHLIAERPGNSLREMQKLNAKLTQPAKKEKKKK